jgi:dTDP-glucose pyrophosphorylase
MAGAGSRFARRGYKNPKPLIDVNGVPMIKLVINNIRPRCEHRFIFVCQQEHIRRYDLESYLSNWAPNAIIVSIDGLTEGAACTVLAAKEYINNSDALMIANSDQYIDASIDEYLEMMNKQSLDGLIMTMKADDPKWSFVAIGEDGCVSRVVEKEVISNEATVGIYNFKSGRDFVDATREMIRLNLRINNEFYVAPAYNQLISKGRKIGIYNIGEEMKGMYGLGVPEDLDLFTKHPVSSKAIQAML